ncbi:hypothetical protein K435DRAFT_787795 [Dendrothele bispora CBS 962.96]|uniref:Uncharacterized protein n=1 Tax=Dendrothele bispora (strain CBS 962.96) TaxID=1314807 RepID=A0A4V4HIY0_DENBC|nr:hypothetical protein K435DRAFT_787795 [Dendrothele bispora CBS 962.96]
MSNANADESPSRNVPNSPQADDVKKPATENQKAHTGLSTQSSCESSESLSCNDEMADQKSTSLDATDRTEVNDSSQQEPEDPAERSFRGTNESFSTPLSDALDTFDKDPDQHVNSFEDINEYYLQTSPSPRSIVREIVRGTNRQPKNIEISVEKTVFVHRDTPPTGPISHELFNILTYADATNIAARYPEIASTVLSAPLSAHSTPVQTVQGPLQPPDSPPREAMPIHTFHQPNWAYAPDPDPKEPLALRDSVKKATSRGGSRGGRQPSTAHPNSSRGLKGPKGRRTYFQGREYHPDSSSREQEAHRYLKQSHLSENSSSAWDTIPAPENSMRIVDPHSHVVNGSNSTKVDGSERMSTGPEEEGVDKCIPSSDQWNNKEPRRREIGGDSVVQSASSVCPEYQGSEDVGRCFALDDIQPTQIPSPNGMRQSCPVPSTVDQSPVYLGSNDTENRFTIVDSCNRISARDQQASTGSNADSYNFAPSQRTYLGPDDETVLRLGKQTSSSLDSSCNQGRKEINSSNHPSVSSDPLVNYWQNIHDAWTTPVHYPVNQELSRHVQSNNGPSLSTEIVSRSRDRAAVRPQYATSYQSHESRRNPMKYGTMRDQSSIDYTTPKDAHVVKDDVYDLPPHLYIPKHEGLYTSREEKFVPRGLVQVVKDVATNGGLQNNSDNTLGIPSRFRTQISAVKIATVAEEDARDEDSAAATGLWIENEGEPRSDLQTIKQLTRLNKGVDQPQFFTHYTRQTMFKSSIDGRNEEPSLQGHVSPPSRSAEAAFHDNPPRPLVFLDTPASDTSTNEWAEKNSRIRAQTPVAQGHESSSGTHDEDRSEYHRKRRVSQVAGLIKVTERYLSLLHSESNKPDSGKELSTSVLRSREHDLSRVASTSLRLSQDLIVCKKNDENSPPQRVDKSSKSRELQVKSRAECCSSECAPLSGRKSSIPFRTSVVGHGPSKYGLIDSGTPPPRDSFTRKQSPLQEIGRRINTPSPSGQQYKDLGKHVSGDTDQSIHSNSFLLPDEGFGQENQEIVQVSNITFASGGFGGANFSRVIRLTTPW